MYKPLKRLGMPLALLSALLLTSCATQTNSSVHSEFCLIASPITWSAKDSDATIAQIKSYNAVGGKLCGW